MTDKALKAFDFAQETTKQLITLATGVLALSVTFLHELTPLASKTAIRRLEWGWILYLISIVAVSRP
jgi:hypothetical protein